MNCGYVPGTLAGDGEEQDVYILGVDVSLDRFRDAVIAIVHRLDDVEDKWVAAPPGMDFTPAQIREKLWFQERYFCGEIICPVPVE